MASDDNPFDLKFGQGLLDPKFGQGLLRFLDTVPPEKPTNALARLVSPAPTTTPGISDIVRALSPPSPHASLYGVAASDLLGPEKSPYGLGNALASFVAPPSPLGIGAAAANPGGRGVALASLVAPPPPPPPRSSLGLGALLGHFPSTYPPAPAPYAPPTPPKPKPVAPAVKRKAFFSFHFDDIMRVNVVRNAWKITHPHNALMRSFYDSSLWESKKLEGPEAVKRLIRDDGVCNTSAVCVLAGADTWERRWVRYEIARAIIDGRGLLTVHLNSIRHHVTKTPHARGFNPLSFMAIGKVQANGLQPIRYFLFEWRLALNSVGNWEWGWYRYDDYTLQVDLPAWVADPKPGLVTRLSDCAAEYDYIAENGHTNIGSWIDLAARRAGR